MSVVLPVRPGGGGTKTCAEPHEAVNGLRQCSRSHRPLASLHRPAVVWFLALGLFTSTFRALADGGLVFQQRSQGDLVLTFFTTSLPIRAGANDLSVLLQHATDRNPVLDAKVELSLLEQEPERGEIRAAWVPPACRNDPPPQLLNLDVPRGNGANRLYYSRLATIPRPGRWLSIWRIQECGEALEVSIPLVVAAPPLPLAGYWLYLALPFGAVLVFGLWKMAVRSRTGTDPACRPAAVIQLPKIRKGKL